MVQLFRANGRGDQRGVFGFADDLSRRQHALHFGGGVVFIFSVGVSAEDALCSPLTFGKQRFTDRLTHHSSPDHHGNHLLAPISNAAPYDSLVCAYKWYPDQKTISGMKD